MVNAEREPVTEQDLAQEVAALRALRVASSQKHAFARPLGGSGDEPFADHIKSDQGWLSAVAVGLADRLGDEERALELVMMNQSPCLWSRGIGAPPWEVAAFLEEGERKRLRPDSPRGRWSYDDRVKFRHVSSVSMLVLKRLVPESPGSLDEVERFVRGAVDDDAFESILAACLVALTASEMARASSLRSRKARRQASKAPMRPLRPSSREHGAAGLLGDAAEEVDRLLREFALGEDPSMLHLLPPNYDPHEMVEAALGAAEQRVHMAAAGRGCPVADVATELFQRMQEHALPRGSRT